MNWFIDLMTLNLEDEDGEPEEEGGRVEVPLARRVAGRGRAGQEGVAQGLRWRWNKSR